MEYWQQVQRKVTKIKTDASSKRLSIVSSVTHAGSCPVKNFSYTDGVWTGEITPSGRLKTVGAPEPFVLV